MCRKEEEERRMVKWLGKRIVMVVKMLMTNLFQEIGCFFLISNLLVYTRKLLAVIFLI